MRRALVDFGRVGDLVMSVPVMRRLAADGPLTLVARPWARLLLGAQPWLAGIATLAQPNRDHLLHGMARRRVARTLAGSFDEVVLFATERPTVRRWIAGWAGSARVVEVDGTSSSERHVIDRDWASFHHAGLLPADGDRVPRLDTDPAAVERERGVLAGLGRRVIAVQVGSSLTHRWFRTRPNLKGLPTATWVEFLVRLAERDAFDALVFHGSAYESRDVRPLIAGLREALPTSRRDRLHDWCGKAGLDRLPAVFAASHALLSVDTGPAHIAAAAGCPTLAVFGPSDPARFAPRGPAAVEAVTGIAGCQFCLGTRAFHDCRDNICLANLQVRHLLDGWERLAARMPVQVPAAISA